MGARRPRRWRAAEADAHRALQDLGPLFDAELRRIARRFDERWQRSVAEAAPACATTLREEVGAQRARHGPALRRFAVEAAQRLARETVTPWLAESEAVAARAYATCAERFVGPLASVIEELRSSGAWVGVPLPDAQDLDIGVRRARRFLFHGMHSVASPAGLVPLARQLQEANHRPAG